MGVIVIVADGARSDVLSAHIDAGALPALARLRAEGAMLTVTTCAPSVTGPAYTPFLLGRYPAPIGLPGLRWYDRSRRVCKLPGNSRSYVGIEMRYVDSDLAPAARTIFELVPSSLAALSVVRRGLAERNRIGYSTWAKFRAGLTHFRGDMRGWLAIDREVAEEFAARVLNEAPEFAFAALTGVDKMSHALGQDAPQIVDALRIVDDLVARLRADLDARGRWDATHLWIVSDHGHSTVEDHEDLARLLADWGHGVRTHPWVFKRGGDVAVMVSGNALAHLYVDLESRKQRWWPSLASRMEPLAQQLLTRESVDLLLLPHSPERTEIRARERGSATLEHRAGTYSYRPGSGDPLGIGTITGADDDAAYTATVESDYPDALVQIAALCGAERSGDLILSAARNWDFRARYEPIPHVSSHGALHREHMRVPLLVNRPPRVVPRRTVDVFPSALTALGVEVPEKVDGTSFL